MKTRKKPQTNANPKPDQFCDPHVVVQTLGLAQDWTENVWLELQGEVRTGSLSF